MCGPGPFLECDQELQEREGRAEWLHMWAIGEPVQGTWKDGREKVTVGKAYTPWETRQSRYEASEMQLLR